MLKQIGCRNDRCLDGDDLASKLLKVSSPSTCRSELRDRLSEAGTFLELRVEVDDRLVHHALEAIPQLRQNLACQLGSHVVLVRQNPNRRPRAVALAEFLDRCQLPREPVK